MKFIPYLLLLVIILGCPQKELVSSNYTVNDSLRLNEVIISAKHIPNLKSLTVSRNGVLRRDAYFNNGSPDTLYDVRSVTKTVSGILIGIALDKGYLSSLDQQLGEFLKAPEYIITPDKARITIRHLLTMSSGFAWNEMNSVNEYNNWISADNQVQYLLNRPLVNVPGTVFNYNTAALHLLSVILTKATGMTTFKFAQINLFIHLGIQSVKWETDHQGYNNCGAGLKIKTKDMRKIGQLYLDRGIYQGIRILSEKWISQSTLNQIVTPPYNPFSHHYGYCWWKGEYGSISYYYANGYGGQFIVVVPALGLLVTTTSKWSGISNNQASSQWYKILDLIVNRIIPIYRR